jgi:hypothetical protein
MTRGDTYVFDLAVIQNSLPFDLTGATVRMTAKWNYTDADLAAVFAISTDTGDIVVTDAAGGLATVTVPITATSSLPAAQVQLVYDIQVTDSASHVFTVNSGILYVQPDVSITTP